MEEKKKVREEMVRRRNTLNPDEVLNKSRIIFDRVYGLKQYKESSIIMCYMDFRNEVMTQDFIHKSLSSGKRVLIPVVDRIQNSMIASELLDMEKDLVPGSFGILEPAEDCLRPVPPGEIQMVIVPGVCFDRQRNRLGYGAGYYDRFLPCLRKEVLKIGVAFEMQLVERLPTGEYDVPMDMIVSEHGIIR